MKNKAIGLILLVFIFGGIASEFAWVGGNRNNQPKPRKEVLIDSIKIDSLTIKLYRNERTD